MPLLEAKLESEAAESRAEEWDLFRPQDRQKWNVLRMYAEKTLRVSGSEASTADDTCLAEFREAESSTWSFRLSDFLPLSTKLKLDKNAAANARVSQTEFNIKERVHVYALQGLAMESLNHVLQFASEEPENNLYQAMNSARNKCMISHVEYELYKELHDKPDTAPYWEKRRQGIFRPGLTISSAKARKCTSIADEDRGLSSSSSAKRCSLIHFYVVVDNWRRLTLALLDNVCLDDLLSAAQEHRADR